MIVGENGQGILTHCNFDKCGTGVQMKERNIKIQNCCVTACDYGMRFGQSGDKLIAGCNVENCSESGILIKGSKQTCRVYIGDTPINNCHNGITCEMDKIVVSIVSTTITDMKCCGVLVCPSEIGRV